MDREEGDQTSDTRCTAGQERGRAERAWKKGTIRFRAVPLLLLPCFFSLVDEVEKDEKKRL